MNAVVRHDAATATDDVPISLTGDEALVLFDLLHRWEDDEQVSSPQHQAEQVALWNLSALLERAVPEALDPRYTELISLHPTRRAARTAWTPTDGVDSRD